MPVTINCTLDRAIAEQKENAKRAVDYARRNARRQMATLRTNGKMLAKLILALPPEAKLELRSEYSYMEPTVEFDREYLPLIRKCVGRLHVDRKSLVDADKGILNIHLKAEKYPGVEFIYERPLGTGCQCRIVEQTSTYKSLVCSIE